MFQPKGLAHPFQTAGTLLLAFLVLMLAGSMTANAQVSAGHGLRIDLAPPGQAPMTLMTAPGLIVPLGIVAVDEIRFGERHVVRSPQGVVAVDGERELEFGAGDHVTIRLECDGPFTIDIDKVMHRAAQDRLLVNFAPPSRAAPGEEQEECQTWNYQSKIY